MQNIAKDTETVVGYMPYVLLKEDPNTELTAFPLGALVWQFNIMGQTPDELEYFNKRLFNSAREKLSRNGKTLTKLTIRAEPTQIGFLMVGLLTAMPIVASNQCANTIINTCNTQWQKLLSIIPLESNEKELAGWKIIRYKKEMQALMLSIAKQAFKTGK